MKIYLFKVGNSMVYKLLIILLISLIVFTLSKNYSSGIAKEVSMLLSIYSDSDKVNNLNRPGKLAIIIDDFGQSRDGVKEMMAINRHMTFEVMPFLEFSKEDAKKSHVKGFEVIVHLAMESNYGKMSWLGPRPIMATMQSDEVKKIVIDSFKTVPYALGANIHMGSKASDRENIISGVLDIIKEKNLYFVDSLTASHHISRKLAAQKEIACYERDVFLDGQQPKAYIKGQLIKAVDIAKERGYAIAIGHVGIEGGKPTAATIAEMLPYFESKNIQLVYISELKPLQPSF
jgi:hypothetical protein